ncbi:isochorismatase family protein [Bordetella holmesii]|uniref:Isochorismatase family protein n=2 Tax=Bordetella holmesii TaxID=35814 RepID=A0A158M2Q5_9BORD|nr:isochorismatase family protein [Bordetella holmesii]AHV94514.1 isochorismatase family protein [Bordetella holmesii ATCC 51541]AIT24951.1 isochorismatase family protein [Bordetella holmesii 44057]EWM45514.1 isochorismatase family protein [Bordetella holmesii 70147]EWM48415.1 isochorismatase family protein [Bordetella holmesii 41130]EWM49640.1 isochorismatase family protein [Bordetella holmesii 35009]
MSETKKRIWDDFLTDRDKQVLAQAGYGKRGGFGKRPALFIIDVQYNFCGDTPEDILEGLKQYRTHCGREAWQAVEHIVPLLELAREKNIPVFYTESGRRADLLDSGVQVGKNHRGGEKTVLADTHATQTVEALAPRPQDIRITKQKPSCFFGTIFMSHLNFLDVDTLILVGCTSSGCLRATTVDAYSYNFKVIIPEECAFDRFQSSHAMSLFDLNCKYADVIPSVEVQDYLRELPAPKAD